MNKRNNIVFVLSAPSGTGKTTVCERVLRKDTGIKRIITITTRKPRTGEKNGRDYEFVSLRKFNAYINKHKFVEYAQVHGEKYGTPKDGLDAILSQHKDAILVIDVQGGLSVKKEMPDAVLIFLKPPSMKSLKERLYKRSLDSEKLIARRLHNAMKEMKSIGLYDYRVLNKDLHEAVNAVLNIIKKERKKH
ncbi:MAG: guanylate kinase [bacterium]